MKNLTTLWLHCTGPWFFRQKNGILLRKPQILQLVCFFAIQFCAIFKCPTTQECNTVFLFHHFRLKLTHKDKDHIYVPFNFLWRYSPDRAQDASFFFNFRLQTVRQTHTQQVAFELVISEDATYTTRKKHKKRTFMPSVGFESATSAINRLQFYSLDRLATGTGVTFLISFK